jgi:hypothetical protein
MRPAMLERKLLIDFSIDIGVKDHKRNKKLRTVQIGSIWNPLDFFQQGDQMLVDKFA